MGRTTPEPSDNRSTWSFKNPVKKKLLVLSDADEGPAEKWLFCGTPFRDLLNATLQHI